MTKRARRRSAALGRIAVVAIAVGSAALVRSNSLTANAYPVWSSDGKRIAFPSNRTGDYEIFVMNGDGSSPQRLTENDGLDVHPSWSPDGKRLVFASVRNANNYSDPGKLQL